MEPEAVRRLCVVGAGTMGHQIAMLGALAGCATAVVGVSAEALNPPLVMELVEVVMHPETGEATAAAAMGLARQMGRTPVLLRREISGFVVNRILAAIMDEAVRLYEAGIASFEDIDVAVKKGLRHPMGPFELMDMNGIDIAYHVRMQRFGETGDPAQRPARSIVERYERGDYGRKTGRGWYTYPPPPSS